MNTSWLDYMGPFIGPQADLLTRIAETLLLLLVYLGLRVAAARLSLGVFKDAERRFRILKLVNLVLSAIVLLCLYQLWLNRGWSVASFVGLLSAGLAIIFREPLLNLAGWMFILARRPFALGDRIQLGDGRAGDVIDLGFNDITLMEIGNWVSADQSTGRILHVPNSVVFTGAVANYNEGFPFLWNELQVPLTYESDWEQAREKLQALAEKVCGVDADRQDELREELRKFDRYFISFQHLAPYVWVSRHDYGVMLTVRYLCEPRRRRSSEHEMWTEIFREFLPHQEIHLAYPTKRLLGELSSLP